MSSDLRPTDIDENDDALLRDAFRSVRDRYDGTNEESEMTLRRALVHTRLQDRRRSFTRWVVLPIAAVLAASTAWAAGTGRLSPALSTIAESLHAERETTPTPVSPAHIAPKPSETTAAEAPPAPAASEVPSITPAPAEPTETGPIAIAPAPAPARASAQPWRPSTPAPTATATTATTATSGTASAAASEPVSPTPPAALSSDPNGGLFAEAHRIHFGEKDPARALAAWDRYLSAAPDGRFAPEARYNRAIALVRLGRRDEAKKELAAFANGSYGAYRKEESRALLEALDRDH